MDESQTIGGKARRTTQRKRSNSPVRAVKKGPAKPHKGSKGLKGTKKGGIDLTPFLTSLLLLGSRMAFDKRSPSKAFSRLLRSAKKVKNASKGRKGRRTYGGSAEEIEENVLETFNNADPDPSDGPSNGTPDGTPAAATGGGRKGRTMKRKAPRASRSKSPKARRAASPKPRKSKPSAKGGAKKPKAKTVKKPSAPKSPRRVTPKSPRRK